MTHKTKMQSRLALFITGLFILTTASLKAQVTNNEGFEGTFVPTGWTNLNISGTNTWTQQTAGTYPTQAPHSGNFEAKFNSFSDDGGIQALITPSYDLSYIGSNTATVSFWMYRDGGYSTTEDKIDIYMNTTADLTGASLLGTVNRSNELAPIEANEGWYQYTYNVPNTFTGSTNHLILQGTSAYGNNIFIDDVSWISYPSNCSGTPTPGNTIASSDSICPSALTMLTLENITAGNGVTYQWQSSTDNVNYTDIIGATGSQLTTDITENTFFKCNVTCTAGSTSAFSTAVEITLNSFIDCYCTLTATSTSDTDIGNVTFGTLNNGTATPVTDNSTATGMYSDYTSTLNAPDIEIGSSEQISLSQITSGTSFYGAWFNVFIDYNQNGEFDLPEERVFTSTANTIETASTVTGLVTIPATALTGTTKMRVRLTEGGNSSNTACGTFSYGEVEDYLINIICPTDIAPSISSVSVCANGTATLTAVPFSTESTLSWFAAETGGSALTTGNTYTTPSISTNTSFWVEEAIGTCPLADRTEAIVTVNPVNVALQAVNTTCNGGNNGTFTLGAIACGTAPFTYSVDGGAFGTIPSDLSAGQYSIVVKDNGGLESAAIMLMIGEPSLVISAPLSSDTAMCVNSLSAILVGESNLSTYSQAQQIITFDVSAQPAEILDAPGGLVAQATMTPLPAGAIISSIAFAYPDLEATNSSYTMDVQLGFTGALTNAAESGMGLGFGAGIFTFIDTISVDSLHLGGGNIDLLYWDSYDDNASADECTFPIGTAVATLTIKYIYPTPASTTWWDAAAGGNQIGTGSTIETVGTSVLPTTSVLGTYNFYAQGENNGCTSTSRSLFTVTLDSPSRTITEFVCDSYLFNGETYDSTGTYSYTIPSVGPECDSTVILDLTVFETPTISVDAGGTILTASTGGTSYQWINCTTNTVISGATQNQFTATANGSYAVISTNGSCSDTSNCIAVTTVNLSEITSSAFEVNFTPNPTSDKVEINLKGINNASLEIFDMQGKRINTYSKVENKQVLSLEGIETGIYLVKVRSELGMQTLRLVKN